MALSPLTEQQEAVLVRRVLAGHSAAFGELIDAHSEWMMRVAFRMTRNEATSEELVQEAFFKTWKSLEHWQPKARLSTWIYRILVNLCIDHARKQQIHLVTNGDDDGANKIGEDGRDLMENHDIKERVWQAIEQLPSRQKAAFILCQYEGHSMSEAADIMASSIGAIESLLIRAKMALRKTLANTAKDYIGEKPITKKIKTT